MKKKIFMIIAIIILFFTILSIIDYFSIDRSGELTMDGIIFKGEEYKRLKFAFTKEGKTIGKADSYEISEIPEDKNHNFLAIRSFLDNWYVVKSSYEIPEDGNITVVYIEYERYTNQKLIDAINYIINEEITDKFYIKTDNIERYVRDIYVGYEDCPVGTQYIGMFGKINEKLIYIKPTEREYNDNGSRKEQIYCCYLIPDKYIEAFGIYYPIPEHTVDIVSLNLN